MTEFWMVTWPLAGRTAQIAKLCEEMGWDGMLVTDTQCLASEALVELALGYDMAHHASSAAPHARALPDAFIDGFAAVGDAERVTDRLRAIQDTGVDRIVIIPGSLDVDLGLAAQSIGALSTAVLPKLR